MQLFERYWLFAASCLLVAAFLVRLLLRERITLQSSLAFLLFLLAMLAMALFPNATGQLAHAMGFSLPSNFFFTVTIGVLVVQHVGTIVALSRLELRSIALTQELALLQEQLGRLNALSKVDVEKAGILPTDNSLRREEDDTTSAERQ